MEVKDIISRAVSLGACIESGKATDWRSLVWLFFSPQGREFCKDNNYPTIDMFRQMAPHVEPYGVWVEKVVNECNKDIALIGDCGGVSELSYSGMERAYKVLLMHGAKAVVNVGNYAVVRIENISGELEINNDGTAEVLL